MSEHTQEPWELSVFTRPDGSPIRTVDDVVESLAASARHGEAAELHGVTVAGTNTVIAYTGNGPTSAANARRICAAVNACRGLPTEALEAGFGTMARDLTAARQSARAANDRADRAKALLAEAVAAIRLTLATVEMHERHRANQRGEAGGEYANPLVLAADKTRSTDAMRAVLAKAEGGAR